MFGQYMYIHIKSNIDSSLPFRKFVLQMQFDFGADILCDVWNDKIRRFIYLTIPLNRYWVIAHQTECNSPESTTIDVKSRAKKYVVDGLWTQFSNRLVFQLLKFKRNRISIATSALIGCVYFSKKFSSYTLILMSFYYISCYQHVNIIYYY